MILRQPPVFYIMNQVSTKYPVHFQVVSCSESKHTGHFKADTLIIYFACVISPKKKVIIIRTDDTDVFILLLHHQMHMFPWTTVFVDMGHSSRNNRRCIDMTSLANALGPQVHGQIYSNYAQVFMN